MLSVLLLKCSTLPTARVQNYHCNTYKQSNVTFIHYTFTWCFVSIRRLSLYMQWYNHILLCPVHMQRHYSNRCMHAETLVTAAACRDTSNCCMHAETLVTAACIDTSITAAACRGSGGAHLSSMSWSMFPKAGFSQDEDCSWDNSSSDSCACRDN